MSFDERLEPVRSASFPCLEDERGSLTKLMSEASLQAAGFAMQPRQLLYSTSARAGVLRGLHAQLPPFSEGKILIALSGSTFWVVVDLRSGSRSFGRWQGFELCADSSKRTAIQVPAGFAHGCLARTDATGVLILADRDYSAEHGVGIAWNDAQLAIDWPLAGNTPLLSEAHSQFGSFADFCAKHGSL